MKSEFRSKGISPTFIFWMTFLGVFALTALYRFYQPVNYPALVQFDIFDWAARSADILREHYLVTPTTLWVFPVWNAIVAAVTGLDLFWVYLYSGAVLTTLNVLILYIIGKELWGQTATRFMLIILYALDIRLLARSVNYLPETMTYTFGLALLYFFIRLLKRNDWRISVPAILILTYGYYHLHQSGLNFLAFSIAVFLLYIVFVLPRPRLNKAIILGGLLITAVGVVLANDGLRQQFVFFLTGSGNTDVAFQGTAIPFSQILKDYPLPFVSLLIIGVISAIVRIWRAAQTGTRLTWLVILLIAGFYYSFLYALPNLNLYSLVPWRFYTWFSLYAVFLVAEGFHFLQQRLQASLAVRISLILFLVLPLVHTNLLVDDMFTADRPTLSSIERLDLPTGSAIITTNANLLQTKYALTGRDYHVRQAGPELFRASSSRVAYTVLLPESQNSPTYILLSLFQLRQRPTSIDYWRSSAFFDLKRSLFENRQYFTPVFEDKNIIVYEVVQSD